MRAAPKRVNATAGAVSALGHGVSQPAPASARRGGALHYHPGQYMNVQLDDGRHRRFSMVSKPNGNSVDFHARRTPGGYFTDQRLQSPGNGSPLVMVAAATGFAPIKRMLEALMDDDDCPPR